MTKLAFQSLALKKTSRNLVKRNLVNPLPGIEVGIPVTIFQNIFTNNHYGYDITNSKMLLLQFGSASAPFLLLCSFSHSLLFLQPSHPWLPVHLNT